jgi:hypothetical protein
VARPSAGALHLRLIDREAESFGSCTIATGPRNREAVLSLQKQIASGVGPHLPRSCRCFARHAPPRRPLRGTPSSGGRPARVLGLAGVLVLGGTTRMIERPSPRNDPALVSQRSPGRGRYRGTPLDRSGAPAVRALRGFPPQERLGTSGCEPSDLRGGKIVVSGARVGGTT